jgi:hypothetical protein
MIGQRALAIDHDQIRAMENRREPLQRMVQQRVIGRIVLGVFLMLQKRIAQAFSRQGVARGLEAQTFQVRSAFTLIDVRNRRPVAGDLVANVAPAVDQLAVGSGVGDAVPNGGRPRI